MLFQHVARWPEGLAASHKYAMCAVRQEQYLLLQSNPCTDPACAQNSGQCAALRGVRAGSISRTYTQENAQFHWGVTPQGKWVLFDTKLDPACQKDLSSDKPDLVQKLSIAYDKWWDAVYPEMIRTGGDR